MINTRQIFGLADNLYTRSAIQCLPISAGRPAAEPAIKSAIRILHLEDDAVDAELIQTRLESAGMTCQITRVQTRAEFCDALLHNEYDIILADYNLPGYDGLSGFRWAHAHRPEIPFIFVSGMIGEDAAIASLPEGATDYVLRRKLAPCSGSPAGIARCGESARTPVLLPL